MTTYKHMKKAALFALLSSLCLQAKKLENPVLQLVDGIVLDGPSFRDLVHIRKKGREMQFGIRNNAGHFEGLYSYRGKKYSIHQLAEIEKKFDEWFDQEVAALDKKYVNMQAFAAEWQQVEKLLRLEHEQKMKKIREERPHQDKEINIETAKAERKERIRFKKALIQEREKIKRKHIVPYQLPLYDQALNDLKQKYNEYIKELHEVLHLAKEDYKKVNAPHLEQVQGAKKLLLYLTFESCILHGADGSDGSFPSFLLKWAEVDEGEEFASFDKSIKTLQQFDRLLSDSSNFYADLIDSCPKGKQQCQDLVKNSCTLQ